MRMPSAAKLTLPANIVHTSPVFWEARFCEVFAGRGERPVGAGAPAGEGALTEGPG
jgi:hypothetical protein